MTVSVFDIPRFMSGRSAKPTVAPDDRSPTQEPANSHDDKLAAQLAAEKAVEAGAT